MTKAELESKIAGLIEEIEEARQELIEIEDEEDPWVGTPQSHIDYLHEYIEERLAKYNDLCQQVAKA